MQHCRHALRNFSMSVSGAGYAEDTPGVSSACCVQDALNQRFVLLSDTDIPIYPARVIYSQLMSEKLSRIAACQVPFTTSTRTT